MTEALSSHSRVQFLTRRQQSQIIVPRLSVSLRLGLHGKLAVCMRSDSCRPPASTCTFGFRRLASEGWLPMPAVAPQLDCCCTVSLESESWSLTPVAAERPSFLTL